MIDAVSSEEIPLDEAQQQSGLELNDILLLSLRSSCVLKVGLDSGL